MEILCDNCLQFGPQLSHRFVVGKDDDGSPLIRVQCPTCDEILDHVFVGVGTFDDRSDPDEPEEPRPRRDPRTRRTDG